jgi:hypothetical protein
MPLFFMAITVDGVELNVSWAEDQAVAPVSEAAGGEKPDFSAMKKAELVEYLAPNGDKLDTTLTKAELIKLAEQLYATKG